MQKQNMAPGECRIFAEYANGAIYLPFCLWEIRDIILRMRDMLGESGFTLCGVELYLVDDFAQMRINEDYLECAGPTNIISFPSGADAPGIMTLSINAFIRECRLYAQDAREYFLRLIAHGLGHLAGLDHGAQMDEACGACLAAARAYLTGDE